MGSESGPPTKRLRASLNGNMQLTECVREFKLPRQYPSMVPKMHNDGIIDRTKHSNLTTGVACIPRAANGPRIIENRELSLNSKIRTIKLKGKDGRDLGEVNVQDLPQNIQGKTITIAKNSMKKSPEVIPVTDKTKGITIGVLTPVNIVKSDDFIKVQTDSECIVDASSKKNLVRGIVMPKDPKKITTGVDSQGRPQVLVFQSGKNWHMVKIPNNASSSPGEQTSKITKNCVVGRSQKITNGGKLKASEIQSSNDQPSQNVGSSSNIRNATNNNSSLLNNKIQSGTNQNRTLLKRWSQPRTPDSTTDRCKSISPVSSDSGEQTKPKIEVSRIFGISANKQAATSQSTRLVAETRKPVTRSDTCTQKNPHLGQDVMVVLPSEKDASNADISVISSDETDITTNSDITEKTTTSSLSGTPVVAAQCTTTSITSAWRRKLLSNKNSDAAKYSSSRDLSLSSRQTDKRIAADGEKRNEMTSNLSILEKALSTVEDEVLREKALKALAECGIGIERLVPVRPASEHRPVKDSDTQTSIFGLWDSEQFIHVPKDLPTLERIKIIERTPARCNKNSITNPNSQDLYINGMEMPEWSSTEYKELTSMVEGYVKGNDEATQVAAIFAKPAPVRPEIIEQLEKDYNECKKYDENGLLNIHRAVVADQAPSVIRHLMILRACEESADIPTRDGQTSLELAIRYDASPKIVRLLLDAGAEPISTETGHDSALIIASRQSIGLLNELISRVKMCKYLDNYDSKGFAALHYCAQNGYVKGVMALIRASANVNLRDRRSGRTPLFHAIENEHNDLAQMLLENGAEASIPNYGGQTIFNVIDETKHFNLLEALNRFGK